MSSSLRRAVVPVAGLGTRMLPATKAQPKEMLPVGKKPVVQHIAEELAHNEFDRVLFVTGRGKTAVEEHFDPDANLIRSLREGGKEELLAALEFERSGAQFFTTRQKRLAGLGDAVLHAEEFAGREAFAVALGDSILGRHAPSPTLSLLRDAFVASNCAAVIAFERVPDDQTHQYGIADPATEAVAGEAFVLRDLIEKPSRGEAPSDLAIAARYIFSPLIFDALRATRPGIGGEVQLTDAIRLLIQGGERVLGLLLPSGDRRYDIGNFSSYYQAFIEFALTDPELGLQMRDFTRNWLETN